MESFGRLEDIKALVSIPLQNFTCFISVNNHFIFKTSILLSAYLFKTSQKELKTHFGLGC